MDRHLIVLFAAVVAALLTLGVVICSTARAQDIPRGLGHPASGGAHWYDSGCCNKKDCEPVEQGAIVVTKDGYQVKYLTSRGFVTEGFIPHGSSSIRQSKDSQEHGCANPTRLLCIYIHLGV